MRYQFYICKSDACSEWQIKRFLLNPILKESYSIPKTDLFKPFDVEHTTELLRKASYECEGVKPSFRVFDFRQDKCPLIIVSTEYTRAQEVAEALSECLENSELTVFDGEMDCCTNIKKYEREQFVKVRRAYQRFKLAIQHNFMPLKSFRFFGNYALFKLGECFSNYEWNQIDSAVAVLRHNDFKQTVRLFNQVLEDALDSEEKLYCGIGFFVIENEKAHYKLRFVLEGPGKTPMYMGWMDKGEVKLELLHRQGIFRTMMRIMDMTSWYSRKKSIEDVDEIRSRLYFDERFTTRSKSRNPADRFLDSYKISQWIEKNHLDITYGWDRTHDYSFFRFYTDDNLKLNLEFDLYDGQLDLGWDYLKTFSVFSIPEEQVVPILALIEEVVPYYDNYYNDKLLIRKEEMEMMLERLQAIRLQIIKNPSDPSLGKFAERILSSSEFAWQEDDENSPFAENDDQRKENLFKNRFRILALLDFFAWWMKELLDSPKVMYNGFYVEGP